MARVYTSRRGFLAGAGGLLAGLSTGVATAGTANFDIRRLKSYQIRERRAAYHAVQPYPAPQSNGDESRIPNYAAVFSKTLPHNDLGEPDKAAYQALLRAVDSGSPADLEAIPAGGTARLVNPLAAVAFGLDGADPQQLTCSPPPAFDSAEYAAEVTELYWHALARDVPFTDYDTSPITQQAAAELSKQSFSGPRVDGKVTAATLFRGPAAGDLNGPYLSQFLVQPLPYGTTTFNQSYSTGAEGTDYLTDYAAWLNVQRGIPPASVLKFRQRYIATGRDLAFYVWQDFSYQAFLNAALILNGLGGAAIKDSNPYKTYKRQAGFSTFGGPMVLDLVARAANSALRAIWYQKWAVHRRLRPEVAGGRLHNLKTGKASYPLHKDLLESQAAAMTFEKNGTYLLPQAYPEGSPAHPSFLAGHPGIAGACVTMLKALFNTSAEIANPVAPNGDGTALVPYAGPPLTIGGELDKLASNIGIARHWAGIHYRSDAAESLKLGEQCAIGILGDLVDTYGEDFGGFQLTMFDGTDLVITSG